MTPRTVACQAPLTLGLFRQEKDAGVSCHFLLQCVADSGAHFDPGPTWENWRMREECELKELGC